MTLKYHHRLEMKIYCQKKDKSSLKHQEKDVRYFRSKFTILLKTITIYYFPKYEKGKMIMKWSVTNRHPQLCLNVFSYAYM